MTAASTQSSKVYIAPVETGPDAWDGFYRHLLHLEKISGEKIHQLTDDHKAADFIILTDANDDNHFRGLRVNPLLKQYPEKTFTIYEGDFPQRFVPGIFTSMPKSVFNFNRFLPGTYSYCQSRCGNTVDLLKSNQRAGDIFFSFIGRNRHSIRNKLFKLKFNRDDILIKDSSDFDYFKENAEGRNDSKLRYLEVCLRSRFMLCPRCQGTSSIRLFEAMQMGIAPVIISDKWVRPEGPDWESFAIFVKEKDIPRLPEIVQQYDTSWRERGKLARENWEAWFQPKDEFNFIIANLARLKAQRIFSEKWCRIFWPLILARIQIRHRLSSVKKSAKDFLSRMKCKDTSAD